MEKKVLREGLTYDDVLVVPAYSEVLPYAVSTTTKFTNNITLKIPVISAAMDTVTESNMAIAIAQEGGIGVLHKNMSIERQSIEVRKVKRSESGMILDPITLPISASVGDAFSMMHENKIGGIPIVDDDLYLIGIVTNRDLRFEKDMNLSIKKVMTSTNLITTELSDLANAESILKSNKIETGNKFVMRIRNEHKNQDSGSDKRTRDHHFLRGQVETHSGVQHQARQDQNQRPDNKHGPRL